MMMMMIWLPSMNAYALWTRQMDMISVNGCRRRWWELDVRAASSSERDPIY